MAVFNLEQICRQHLRDNNQESGLVSINLNRVKVKTIRVHWSDVDTTPEEKQAATNAQFERGQGGANETMTNDVSMSNNYTPMLKVTLSTGRVKGLNKKVWIDFPPQLRGYGDGMEIDPSKEVSNPPMSSTTVTTTSSKDMTSSGATASTATLSAYQEKCDGRFTCQIEMRGTVVFQMQREEVMQHEISEIMRTTGGVSISGKKVSWTMEGTCEIRKDSKQATDWD